MNKISIHKYTYNIINPKIKINLFWDIIGVLDTSYECIVHFKSIIEIVEGI